MGAERIIVMSRHADRQKLAREFGATDVVAERGEEGVAAIKKLTDGLGAHSVIEAVGTQQSMATAIAVTRPGGHIGYVGVSHDVKIDGLNLFFSEVHLMGGQHRYASICHTLLTLFSRAQLNQARSLPRQ